MLAYTLSQKLPQLGNFFLPILNQLIHFFNTSPTVLLLEIRILSLLFFNISVAAGDNLVYSRRIINPTSVNQIIERYNRTLHSLAGKTGSNIDPLMLAKMGGNALDFRTNMIMSHLFSHLVRLYKWR